MRNGDFSAATNNAGTQQTIYNPFTGNADGVGREPFANNQIPANLINADARLIDDLLYPLPNTTGIGLGGLTNNYQREETRTVDRKNYDVKINFNRTQAHQLWAKYAFMDAVVDDLTNYLGPDPERRGRRRLHQGLLAHGRPDLDAQADAAPRHDVRVRAAEAGRARTGLQRRQLRSRRARHSRAPTTRALGDQRYAGYPVFNTGLQRRRQPRRLEPDLPRRADVLAGDEPGQARRAGTTSAAATASTSCTSITGSRKATTRAATSTSRATRPRLNATGAPDRRTSTTHYAAFLLGLTSSVAKSVQNELMTGREWQHALYVRDTGPSARS